jgi:hypothetical protein
MTALRKTLHPWTRSNLVLAGTLVILLTLDQIAGDQKLQPTLTGFAIESITEIRVERGARLILAARRADAHWQLTHPAEQPARPERIRQLLAVARAPVRYSFAAPADLERYGLNTPAAVLHVKGRGIPPTVLAFGNRDPDQGHRYVLLKDEVLLIDETFFSLLSLPTSHFSVD